jgi:N-formylglutamate amidohydrolase
MTLREGSGTVPVIYTAHHAGHNFGLFQDRVGLTASQQIRFSDYGTDQTVPNNGLLTMVAETSRALGDLNRAPHDPGRFQLQDYHRPDRHAIWKPGQELSAADKQFCHERYYLPFHRKILEELQARDSLTFVIAWDNTAHYTIGHDSRNQPVTMKPFIISNVGAEEAAAKNPGVPTSCDPHFINILAPLFAAELAQRGLPHQVHLNLVFRGGYITRHYSTRRNRQGLAAQGITAPVQSLQIEYDTAITHDQVTLEPKPAHILALRDAFSRAIEAAVSKYTRETCSVTKTPHIAVH